MEVFLIFGHQKFTVEDFFNNKGNISNRVYSHAYYQACYRLSGGSSAAQTAL